MSTSKRKTKTTIEKQEQTTRLGPEILIQRAAAVYGLDVAQLLSYKAYSGGKVVLVAANGMKFVYEAADGSEPG
jgi:hypothetical protein